MPRKRSLTYKIIGLAPTNGDAQALKLAVERVIKTMPARRQNQFLDALERWAALMG